MIIPKFHVGEVVEIITLYNNFEEIPVFGFITGVQFVEGFYYDKHLYSLDVSSDIVPGINFIEWENNLK